jgi:hypothetical protein
MIIAMLSPLYDSYLGRNNSDLQQLIAYFLCDQDNNEVIKYTINSRTDIRKLYNTGS